MWEGTQSFHVPVEQATYLHVLPHPSGPRTLTFGIFMEVSSCRHDPLISLISSPSPLSGESGWMGLKPSINRHGLIFLVTHPHLGAQKDLPH